jgi:hypothetical protein
MLNQISIVTPELIDKLAKVEGVFIAFNSQQISTVITALELYGQILSNDVLMAGINPDVSKEDRDYVYSAVSQTLNKIEETFNDEFQAMQRARILSNFKQD